MPAENKEPYSIEAEEFLLSCCLLDGADMIGRCLEAHIGPESFYVEAHGVVFERLVELHCRRVPIDVAVVAEELKTARQLELIGGYPFLAQVSSRIPTTAQAGYFIEKVRELALRRELIAAGGHVVETCRNFTGNVDELLASVQAEVGSVLDRARTVRRYELSWDALLSFDGRADPDCLMGKRFLGRTDGAVIVAPSGVGKSVLSVGLGSCAALGRPFFGVQMSGPLRVLYAQAEDGLGDVAESVQGFIREHQLAESDIASLRSRLRIVRWNDCAGATFLERLRSEHARHPFDLAIVNPLFSFCGCNVSDQAEMSAFLRNGLNPILNDTRAAAFIVHHTNKPPPDGAQAEAAGELRYLGSGSAELTNWARAYMTLQPVKGAGEGVYKLVFAKRGTRAGIVDDNGHPITSVLIQHSGRGLCWIPSDYSPTKTVGGRFAARFDVGRAAQLFNPALDWPSNEQAIAFDQEVDRRTVRRHRQMILDTAA